MLDKDLEVDTETHGVETAFYDKSSVTEHTQDNQQLHHANETMNDYDVYSPGDLVRLAADDSIEGREKILSLAEKYDIPVDGGASSESIIGRIINTMNSQDSPNSFMGSE